MKSIQKEALTIVGISVRTSNDPGKGEKDIPALWNRYMEENIGDLIPHKKNETLYGVYTDYEGDHTQPYTLLIGSEVSSLDDIPENLSVKVIPAAKYAAFTAKGDLTQGAVINTWMEVWKADLNRTFTFDLEVYGEKAMNPKDGEADVLIAIAD